MYIYEYIYICIPTHVCVDLEIRMQIHFKAASCNERSEK